MRRSLRFRLTASIVVVLAAVLVALALVLHALFARALVAQFDGRLIGDAEAVAGMAEDDASAGEFEYESLPDFERALSPAYFQAWLDDGRVLARSPSLGAHDLARAVGQSDEPRVTDVMLPDWRAGRAAQLRQPLRIEDASAPAGVPAHVSGKRVTVVVARGTEELAQALSSVRRWLFGLALLALLGASAAAVYAVSRGLRPARALGDQLARLDAANLVAPAGGVLEVADLPDELAPLVAKMNEMLARLRASFAREKRFTADVSHELRTPLAALRTTLEVALSRERDAPEYRAALDQAGAVVRQMQGLCENLLALARLDAGLPPAAPLEIDLHALVRDCWRLFEATARTRGLAFQNELAVGAVVATDPDRLRVIVTNLLSNAAIYTAPGGTIRVRQGRGASPDLLLEVHDTGPPIAADALPHVFERFFRGDPTRADGVHCGIGLALVRGLSDALGLTVTARNTADGGVSFALARR
jgi:two-component system sensor histidine kinase QseC